MTAPLTRTNQKRITRAVVRIEGSCDAQYAVGLLFLIVESLLKQDGNRGGIGKPLPQTDLVIVYRHFLEHTNQLFSSSQHLPARLHVRLYIPFHLASDSPVQQVEARIRQTELL